MEDEHSFQIRKEIAGSKCSSIRDSQHKHKHIIKRDKNSELTSPLLFLISTQLIFNNRKLRSQNRPKKLAEICHFIFTYFNTENFEEQNLVGM